MIDSRDALLEILASGAAFKGQLTLTVDFDIPAQEKQSLKTLTDVFKEGDVEIKSTFAPKKKKRRKTLSNEEVWAIRRLHKEKHPIHLIAKELDINHTAVWRVVNKKSYRKVGDEPHDSVTVRAGHGVVKGG